MIGSTAIDQHMKRAIYLSDAVAWYDAHTPFVRKLVVDLIRYEQLKKKGVDKFNEIIGTYSPITEMINPEKVAGTPYTLEDTGAFYRSMFIVVLKNSIVIEADAQEMEDQYWWSTNILGLNEQNLEIYISEIRKNYIKYARSYLGIN